MDQLLNTLSNEVLNEQTVKEVSENAGVTPQETIEVVNNAIPALVNSFSQTATRSAATERGAADLMSLLMQATSTNTATTNNASLGTSLLSTLLGGNNNTNTLVNAISGNTGVKTSGVSKILKYIAPVLISALIKKVLTGSKPAATATVTNANTQTNNNANLLSALLGGSQQSQQVQQPQSSGVNLSDGLDINDLMGLLGGAQQSQQTTQQKPQSQNNNMNSILSALLGGSQQQSQQVQQPKPQQSSGVNLSDGLDMNDLMALLNGSQQTQQTQQTTQQQSTGTDLTSLLGLLGNLTSTNTAQTTTTTSNKKKKTSSSSTTAQSNSGIDLSDGIDMNDILGLLGTLNKK